MENADSDPTAAAPRGSSVSSAMNRTRDELDAALGDQVGLAVLHEVDEALRMPRVGAVARAVDPVGRVVEEAVGAAVDAVAGQEFGAL